MLYISRSNPADSFEFLSSSGTHLLDHLAADGRWEWEYDMMEPVKVKFEWLQTGEPQRVNYRYPFADDWNRHEYTRENNGIIYIQAPSDSD